MIITFFVSITFYSIFIIRRSFDCKLIIITFSSSSLSPAYPSSERLYVEVPDIDHFLPSSSLSGVFVIILTFDHPRHEQHLKLGLAMKLYTFIFCTSSIRLYTLYVWSSSPWAAFEAWLNNETLYFYTLYIIRLYTLYVWSSPPWAWAAFEAELSIETWGASLLDQSYPHFTFN